MAGNPERKVRLLGKEFKPEHVALGGVFLMLGGIWAGSEPCLALPAIAVGLGLMVHGTAKMKEGRKGNGKLL